MPDEKLSRAVAGLSELMAALRKGCPWDREQTHTSLRRYLLEECYEVLDCLDREDLEGLRGELGDLLFQVWFHCEIAAEGQEHRFDLADVLNQVRDKLERRHPHVFGDARAEDAPWVMQNWQKMKMAEGRRSRLEGVPMAMPSLQVAQALQEKAAQVGFDWPAMAPVLEKVREELDEFLEECRRARDEKLEASPALRGEFGDLLFALVNVGRWLRISPEDALRETNIKFRRRFQYIEDEARRAGRSLEDMTLEEMDALWDEAKGLE